MPRKVTFKAGIEGGATRDLTVEIHDLDAEPWGLGHEHTVVGTDVPRLEALEKATGAAKYTSDILPERLLFVRFLHCYLGHARVATLDLEAARAVPGVVGVREVVGAGGRVTYAGQIVAAVCAETEEAAEDGVHAIRVAFERRPMAVTVEDALPADAPRVDPNRENAVLARRRGSIERGDPDAALTAAKTTVKATFRTPVQTHSALEPHGSVIVPQADGSYVVYASTQGTGAVRGGMLRLLAGRDAKGDEVRVIAHHIGGGFGAKLGGPMRWDRVAARFAVELDRPIKAMLDRRAEHLIAGNRPDSIQELTLGADGDGRLSVLVGTTHGTAGNGAGGAGAQNTRVYPLQHVRMQQTTVSTFGGQAKAFRAPGCPQGAFAIEGAVDMMAVKLGVDPLEFRMAHDPHPIRAVQWKVGAERIGWSENRRKKPGSDSGPIKRGVGCAAGFWFQAGRGSWTVRLDVNQSGAVTVSNAVQDIGTGTRTLLAIIVAEELGIAPSDVSVRIGDTLFPAGPGSGGSTTAPSIGPAAREAAVRAREGLAAKLAEHWGVPVAKIESAGGRFSGPGGKGASFREACALLGVEDLSVSGQRRPNFTGFHPETAGCQFAQVAVDVETGVVRVERVVAVHDAGRIINALAARSQVIGGVIQGVSYALFEERQLDRNLGDMVNPRLDTYRIVGMRDCPEIIPVLTSIESGFNNAGMMGLGEPVTVPTAGAIANAVANATGVRMTEIPLTPRRVLDALRRGG